MIRADGKPFERVKNLKSLLAEKELHERKRIETESELSIKLDSLMRRFVNTTIRQRFNLSQG